MYAHNILVTTDGSATLCDFGASFAYENSHQVFFQAMEVRAFGLFLRDLVGQVSFESTIKFSLSSDLSPDMDELPPGCQQLVLLKGLSDCCLREPNLRPAFSDIVSTLKRTI